MAGLQRDRIYELIVGDIDTPQSSLKFTTHQMAFEIKKTSNNAAKGNKSTVRVYNLTDNQLKVLEGEYPTLTLSVGYAQFEGLKRILAGEIVHFKTVKRGTDRITDLMVSQNYTGLNHSVLSTTAPPGSKVKDAINAIISGMTFGEKPSVTLTGKAIERDLLYGFPLSGSPKDMLSKLAASYSFEWRIDDNAISVNDADRAENENFETAKVISREAGLIENAYYETGDVTKAEKDPAKKNGVRFRMLLDASVIPGQIVEVKDTLVQGHFKVDDISYKGNYRDKDWYADVHCSAIEKVVKN